MMRKTQKCVLSSPDALSTQDGVDGIRASSGAHVKQPLAWDDALTCGPCGRQAVLREGRDRHGGRDRRDGRACRHGTRGSRACRRPGQHRAAHTDRQQEGASEGPRSHGKRERRRPAASARCGLFACPCRFELTMIS